MAAGEPSQRNCACYAADPRTSDRDDAGSGDKLVVRGTPCRLSFGPRF